MESMYRTSSGNCHFGSDHVPTMAGRHRDGDCDTGGRRSGDDDLYAVQVAEGFQGDLEAPSPGFGSFLDSGGQ